jgi:uridine monophosphate synthetase
MTDTGIVLTAGEKESGMDFFTRLDELVDRKNSCLCVGLDPYFDRKTIEDRGLAACVAAAREANLRIIEASAPYAACFKPNIAFYEALGAEGMSLLRESIQSIPEDIPVLIDAKRGDIGSTARAYADAIFGDLGADAVTLSPYLGKESVEPFLDWKDRGLFLLCRTSNPGSGVFQDLRVEGEPLYIRIARELGSWAENIGLVVAGNDLEALAAVRAAAPGAWFLSPGIGAQGGKAEDALRAGARADGSGVLVVAARSVAGAGNPAEAAKALRDEINRGRAAASLKYRTVTGWSQAGEREALKERLVHALISTGCFRLGDFTLKSGKKSPFYIDLRRLISDPKALALAGKAYAMLAKECSFDRLAGIPAAALPLATAAALALEVPMIWPRMPVKDHGTGNRVEGAFSPGDKVLLLDDLITTGLSKREAVEILRAEALVVEDLVVLVERGKEGRSDMESSGIRLHAFLHIREIVLTLERLGIIDSQTRMKLERYAEEE